MKKITLSLSAILLASGISIASDNVESNNTIEFSKEEVNSSISSEKSNSANSKTKKLTLKNQNIEKDSSSCASIKASNLFSGDTCKLN
ncbi:hypothetical protein [Helicobacter sp. MIT 14-3879]|uniref:hypothetical protein n=1 Tax=Helicobacter sp. MIT 14-3879 TaxID=2040649 RepID=UPI000E1ED60C|nr:hypothetical protein [Helicobacter sp. MIT 14-3879]RDU65545.1 hypothetical protein CQA44_00740 [Helicobacter sp. MIT 14-3879]